MTIIDSARPRARTRAATFRNFQAHARCPKPTTMPERFRDPNPAQFSWLTGRLGPAERRAMREIAERADLLEVDGRTFLLVPIGAETLDALAAFEAEGDDDLHPDHDVDGCHTEYGELDLCDDEPEHEGGEPTWLYEGADAFGPLHDRAIPLADPAGNPGILTPIGRRA